MMQLVRVPGDLRGVPVILGTGGVERIIEVQMDDAERKMFQTSVDHVKELVKTVKL